MRKLACLLAFPLFANPVWAADLLEVYRAAQENDPVFAAARATREAGQEKGVQGRAGLLPSLNLHGKTSSINRETLARNDSRFDRNYDYNTHEYSISLTQPLINLQNWVSFTQAKLQVAQAEAVFAQAQQELILRVAQAYFDVLQASENLKAVQANKTAIAQQLELAKKSFEVGTATITDSHEAQARFDLATAQEIAAASDLEVRQQVLQSLIGKDPGPLAAPRSGVQINPPAPNRLADWLSAAETQSLNVQIQQTLAEIASREVDKQRAAHYPTVHLFASQRKAKDFLGDPGMGDTEYNEIGVQLNIPLFQGGLTSSRQREAAANRSAALSGLEAARRNASLATRQYYVGVNNGLAQINALKAALTSSQSALESNKLGYEVGVRINIDVLNAENQVYVTRRDLAKATFETLMAQLRLKAAVGSLSQDDLAQINALLEAPRSE